MDVYFACGSGHLINDHAFCFPDIGTEAFLLSFIYYDVEQML